MNMKRLLTLVAFFATLHASAQQVNPVPDYVFANRMSAGRNTVTDTAAYFSIGPRYGATRGMMPPMVVDTASFSGNKRNGLLIFSVQKNKFLYWDSVGVKWAEMAGTAGTALTSADTAALLSTRAWRQKGIDSLAAVRIAGSGTTNYIAKFSASSTLSNSIGYDNGGEFLINTTSDNGDFRLQVNGSAYVNGNLRLNTTAGVNTLITQPIGTGGIGLVSTTDPTAQNDRLFSLTFGSVNYPSAARIEAYASEAFTSTARGTYLSFRTTPNGSTTVLDRMIINNLGFVGIGTALPTARLHIVGNLINTDSAFFATSTGRVGVGTISPAAKFDVTGSGVVGRYTSSSNPVPISIYHTGSSVSTIGFKGSTTANDFNIRVGADGDDYISYTNNTERLRITSLGIIAVNTNSPSASAQLDVSSTTRGFLPPRMTTAQRDAISSPAAGLIIYNTTTSKLQVYTTTWTDLH